MDTVELNLLKNSIEKEMKSYEYWRKEFNYDNKSVSTAFQAGIYDGLKCAMQFIDEMQQNNMIGGVEKD